MLRAEDECFSDYKLAHCSSPTQAKRTPHNARHALGEPSQIERTSATQAPLPGCLRVAVASVTSVSTSSFYRVSPLPTTVDQKRQAVKSHKTGPPP